MINKHPLNRLVNFLHLRNGKPHFNFYRRVLNKDDSFSLILIGYCDVHDSDYLKRIELWYDKYHAPLFEFKLRVRELRIAIRKFLSNLFKKD